MTPKEISVEEAVARLDELNVVDVRGTDEFDGPLGRIAGAMLVPLDELEARAAELPVDRPLLMVCRSGRRSEVACQKLAGLGLAEAINLAGGMLAWNEANLPVEVAEVAGGS